MLEFSRMSDAKDKSNTSSSDISSYMYHGPGSAVYRMRAKNGSLPSDSASQGRGEVAEIATVIGKLLFGTAKWYVNASVDSGKGFADGVKEAYENLEEFEEEQELNRAIEKEQRMLERQRNG